MDGGAGGVACGAGVGVGVGVGVGTATGGGVGSAGAAGATVASDEGLGLAFLVVHALVTATPSATNRMSAFMPNHASGRGPSL